MVTFKSNPLLNCWIYRVIHFTIGNTKSVDLYDSYKDTIICKIYAYINVHSTSNNIGIATEGGGGRGPLPILGGTSRGICAKPLGEDQFSSPETFYPKMTTCPFPHSGTLAMPLPDKNNL